MRHFFRWLQSLFNCNSYRFINPRKQRSKFHYQEKHQKHKIFNIRVTNQSRSSPVIQQLRGIKQESMIRSVNDKIYLPDKKYKHLKSTEIFSISINRFRLTIDILMIKTNFCQFIRVYCKQKSWFQGRFLYAFCTQDYL